MSRLGRAIIRDRKVFTVVGKVESATLERGNRWKVYWPRSVDTVDEDDVVRADLHEIFDVSDVGEDCEIIGVTEDPGEQ
jgi:hypothetical protein